MLQRFEEVQIARYLPGERFLWHEDAVPPPLLAQDGSDGGQRVATLLVYLSGDGDASKGGATCFRDLGDPPPLRVLPQKGDAILFFPSRRVRPHDGPFQPDDRTVHAGEPSTGPKIEKWVSQLWLHDRPFPPAILQNNDRPASLLADPS